MVTEKLYTLDQAQRELARRFCDGDVPFHTYVVDTDALSSHHGGNPTALRCQNCETVWSVTDAGSPDLRRINDALVEFGISHPLGASGVDDLIVMADHTQDVVKRVTELVEHDSELADPDSAWNTLRLIREALDE